MCHFKLHAGCKDEMVRRESLYLEGEYIPFTMDPMSLEPSPVPADTTLVSDAAATETVSPVPTDTTLGSEVTAMETVPPSKKAKISE